MGQSIYLPAIALVLGVVVTAFLQRPASAQRAGADVAESVR